MPPPSFLIVRVSYRIEFRIRMSFVKTFGLMAHGAGATRV